MRGPIIYHPDPKLDLSLERIVDVPKDRVWRARTTPDELKKWFTPARARALDQLVTMIKKQ